MLILNSTEITGNYNISYNGVALNQIDVVKNGVRTTVWRHGEIVIIVDNQPLPVTVTVGSNSVTVPANTSETLAYNDLAIGTVIKASATGNGVTTEFLNTTYTGVSKAYRVTNTIETSDAQIYVSYRVAAPNSAEIVSAYGRLRKNADCDLMITIGNYSSRYLGWGTNPTGSSFVYRVVMETGTWENQHDFATAYSSSSGGTNPITLSGLKISSNYETDVALNNMTLNVVKSGSYFTNTVNSNTVSIDYYKFTAEEI